MGFQPFDPFGEKEKNNSNNDGTNNQNEQISDETLGEFPIDIEEPGESWDVPIIEDDIYNGDEQNSAQNISSSDRTESIQPQGPSYDMDESAHQDVKKQQNEPADKIPMVPNEVPINVVVDEIPNNNQQAHSQSAPPVFGKNQNAGTEYSNQQNNVVPPNAYQTKQKGRGGIYALLISILVVALLTLGVIAWAIFGVIGLASGSGDDYYSGYDSEAVKMPEVKKVPAGGRKVPVFGQPAGAYTVESNADATVAIKAAVGPAVVGIVDKIERRGSDEFRSGAGSGIVLSKDGYIITNYHVISNADKLYVVFEGETDEIPADLIGYDDIRDIAVIQVARNDLTPPIFGDSSKVQTGEMSVAIGNPLGTLSGTITQGIISASSRELTLETGRTQDFIQTDTAINPGNSGGALLNRKGEVIGINTRKETTIAIDDWGMPIAAEGIGYAIPINDALSIAETLIREGKIERAQMGVTLKMVTADMEEAANGRPGVVVTSIVTGGPADIAGVRKGDIITHVDDHRVEGLSDISNLLDKKKIGEEMRIKVLRDGKEFNYVLTLQSLSKQ